LEERYLSVKTIAHRYDVSAEAVTKWIREGKLRAVKLGGIWRIPESALAAFVKDSQGKGPAE